MNVAIKILMPEDTMSEYNSAISDKLKYNFNNGNTIAIFSHVTHSFSQFENGQLKKIKTNKLPDVL